MERSLVAFARTLATALLLLAVLVSAGFGPGSRTLAAQIAGPNVAGTIVPGMITIQGIVAQDNDRAGSYEYLIDITASADVADGYRIAGAGEQTYIAVDSTTFEDIDVASTDANGIAVLDGEVGASFYIYEINDVDGGGIPIGTDDLFVPADDPNPAISLTGIFYVAGPEPSVDPSIVPSVEPSVAPSTEPLPSGTVTGTILPDAISIQGIVVEDPVRAGETDYLINVTSTAEVGDFRAAFAGEQTYQVVDLKTNQVIDTGSTDANGQVVLDGEVDAAYYVVEVNDTGAIPGTDSLFYAAGDPNAFIALTGIIYVAQVVPSPSPVVSALPSPVASASPSPVASASPSLVASVSPAASPSDVTSPSASNVASASADASLAPSLAASTAPSSADPSPTDPAASASGQAVSSAPGAVVAGDGIAGPSAASSRPAAPVISDRDDIGTLPNTGAGIGSDSSSIALLVSLLAVASLMIVGTAIALRRRGA